MKILRSSILLLGVFAATQNIKAQSVDDIINKHFDAIGGKDKIAQIHSIYMESSVSVMGNEAPSKTTVVDGKGYRNESDFNGQQIIQCITDKGGWMINPMMGQTTATPLPDDQAAAAKENLYIAGSLFNYAEKGNKVTLLGKEKIDSINAYKLGVVSPSGTETTVYIDPSTYYILKIVRSVQGQETSIVFSNYKPTDFGYVVAWTTEITLPQGFSLTSTTTKVEVNKQVDMSIFDMPK